MPSMCLPKNCSQWKCSLPLSHPDYFCAYHEYDQEENKIKECIEVEKRENKRRHRKLEVEENSMKEVWSPKIGETDENDDLFIEEPV